MKDIKSGSKLKSLVFAFLVLNSIYSLNNKAIAQAGTSSPYSRYGIGDVGGKGFTQGFSLGGTNIALQNDSTPMFFINSGNPASYAHIALTVAELGANFNSVELQSETTSKTINNASLAYVSLAFPFKKWWGGSFGLLPYSSVGYKVSDHQEITNVGAVDFLYEGSGGINQVYFGNGIKPFYGLPKMFLKSKKYQQLKEEKKYAEINQILKRKRSWQDLSIGVNASYLFGSIENSRRAIFGYNTNSYNTHTRISKHVSDIYLDYGVQYSFTLDSLKGRDLKDNVKILLGATFSAESNVSAKIDSLSEAYYLSSAGYTAGNDTIQNKQGTNGEITFPLSFGFGIGLKKGDRWMVAADFAMQNWSSYQAFNQSQGLKNSMRVSLGAQYVPDAKALGLNNYYKRMHYRIGIRYAQTALELKGTQLTEHAASFGLGFPVGRNYLLQNFSMVNIGVEYGERGTITNGLIKENFFKLTLGFTINDKWFIKPKIN